MNRGDRRYFMRRLEQAHLELGRAYEHVIQLQIAGHGGTSRMRDAQHRLHRVESKLQWIRAEMNGRQEVEPEFRKTA